MIKIYLNVSPNMACLDARSRLIATIVLSEGTVNEAPVYTREAVRQAIGYNANSVIFAHNHPGESLLPSMDDLRVTQRLKDAMQTINIQPATSITALRKKECL